MTPLLLFAAAIFANITWVDKRPLPAEVAGGYVVASQSKIIYAGGTNWQNGVKHWLSEVNRYDPIKNQWEPAPALPMPLAYGGFCETQSGMEIFGGSDGEKVHRECWRLEPGAKSWKQSGMLSSDPLLGRVVKVDGKVYLFGGCPDVVDLTGCSDTVYVRESLAIWRPVSKMPAGRISDFATAVAGHRVFLFGGCSMPAPGKLTNRNDAYSFEPRTGAWKSLNPLKSANRGLSALTWDDQHIMILGGYTDSGFAAAAYIYDIERDQYQNIAPLPLGLSGLESVRIGDAIFALAGEDKMRGRTARVFQGRF
jgi:N-acetylneuraminic acid mutarotase